MLDSTMQDVPLTITALMQHGRRVYGDSKILTCNSPDDTIREATFTQVADRADQLAAALADLGVAPGDRVGTFMWNNQRHMEAYLAVPCMGAVLHTLNIRLFPEQLAYVADHAEDKVIILDGSLAPLLAKVIDQLPKVETIITCGEGDYSAFDRKQERRRLRGGHWGSTNPATPIPNSTNEPPQPCATRAGPPVIPRVLCTRIARPTSTPWRRRRHRRWGIWAHLDRILLIVPQFHANAWGMPYAAWAAGADIVMPQQFLQAGPIADIIEQTRPTMSGAVPTVLNDVPRKPA